MNSHNCSLDYYNHPFLIIPGIKICVKEVREYVLEAVMLARSPELMAVNL